MDSAERINLIKNSLNHLLTEQRGPAPFPDLGGGRPNIGGGGGGGGGGSPVAPPRPPVSPPSPSPRPRPNLPPRTPPNPPVPQPRPTPNPAPPQPAPRPVPGPGPSQTPPPMPRPVPGPGPSPIPPQPGGPATDNLPRTSSVRRYIGGAAAAGYGIYKLLKGKASEEQQKIDARPPKQFLNNPVQGLFTADGSPIINTENPSQSGSRERSRAIALRYASGAQ